MSQVEEIKYRYYRVALESIGLSLTYPEDSIVYMVDTDKTYKVESGILVEQTITSSGSIEVQIDGVPLGDYTAINFTGSGFTVVESSEDVAIVEISLSGGSGSFDSGKVGARALGGL